VTEAAALFEVDSGRGHVSRRCPTTSSPPWPNSTVRMPPLDSARRPGSAASAAGGGIGRRGLVAAEMRAAGVPWDEVEHDRILTDILGPRPIRDGKPAKMLALADQVRAALEDPRVEPRLPEPAAVLPAQRRHQRRLDFEMGAASGSDHPAIAPLLEYKKMARLLSANGWHWL
jgi:DNA polymerase-1